MKPVISVLMPVYNAERFLGQAIDSILQQTLKEFEFIIINDASTDGSVAIIESFNDPRIKLINNEANLGISATLNKGIEVAGCEWIARMDADDISHRERLEKQYVYCRQHPDVALLSCWARVVDENLKFIRLEKYETPYYFYNLTFECWIYHPTVVYNRNAVVAVGKYTEQFSEDFELFWQLSRKFRIGNIEEALVDYRISSSSLHQVIKKTEYDKAQESQVLRHIHFYMGEDFKISTAELECLRHNFTPLLMQNDVGRIVLCIRKLKQISDRIAHTKNPNYNAMNIEEAIWYKRNFIIDFYARNLNKLKAIYFLILLGEWKRLFALANENRRRLFK